LGVEFRFQNLTGKRPDIRAGAHNFVDPHPQHPAMEAMNDTYGPGIVAAVAAKEIEEIETGLLQARPVITDEETDLIAKLQGLKHGLQIAIRDLDRNAKTLAKRASFTPVEQQGETKRRKVARLEHSKQLHRVAHARHDIDLIRVWALQREIEQVEAARVGVKTRAVESTARVAPEDLVAAAAARSIAP
jgi:hypothetical protein